jgi:hypothetical protein
LSDGGAGTSFAANAWVAGLRGLAPTARGTEFTQEGYLAFGEEFAMANEFANQRDAVQQSQPGGRVLALLHPKLGIFVRRSTQQWVVLDPEGNFWILPSVEHPWDQRQPFCPDDQEQLEPVPGHYKYMLGLPF